MVAVIRRNSIQVVFLRSYLCKFLADRVRNKIITQVHYILCFSFTNFLIQLASVVDGISFFKLLSLSCSLYLSILCRLSSTDVKGSPAVLVSLSFSIGMKERRDRGKKIVDILPMCRCTYCRRLVLLTFVKQHQEIIVVIKAFLECKSN